MTFWCSSVSVHGKLIILQGDVQIYNKWLLLQVIAYNINATSCKVHLQLKTRWRRDSRIMHGNWDAHAQCRLRERKVAPSVNWSTPLMSALLDSKDEQSTWKTNSASCWIIWSRERAKTICARCSILQRCGKDDRKERTDNHKNQEIPTFSCHSCCTEFGAKVRHHRNLISSAMNHESTTTDAAEWAAHRWRAKTICSRCGTL